MKQKTIIQVWGRQNCGKSITIKILKEELILKYIDSSHSYTLPRPNEDIHDILSCRGYKIGIESMGDDLWAGKLHNRLYDRLNDYVLKHNCNLIICASRISNNVSKHIEKLANTNGYRLLKCTNYREEIPSFNQDELNQLSAQHLLDLVNKILIGKI